MLSEISQLQRESWGKRKEIRRRRREDRYDQCTIYTSVESHRESINCKPISLHKLFVNNYDKK